MMISLLIGILRVYQGKRFLDILVVFAPTLAFVTCLSIWSGLRANLANRAHSSTDLITSQSGLSQLVSANGLISCSPMLLCETSFQVFGLLAKRLIPAARKWVKYAAYTARLVNLIALIMCVVAACDLSSSPVLPSGSGETCGTTVLGRDLTLLPLMADGLVLVVLVVLTVLLGPGVVVHVLTIQCCLAFHFTWKCVRDWAALEIYLNGEWLRFSDHFSLKGDLEGLAKRIRRQAEDPTLFYVLGLVPLVLAMVLIYTLNLVMYTNPPATSIPTQDNVTTRFTLFLDPAAPRIELLPTSKAQAANAGKGGNDSKKDRGGGKGQDAEAGKNKGEMFVVKRGWLGGWSVQPAQTGAGWATKAKLKIKQNLLSWALGWSSYQKAPVTAA
ncbi:uncharacterized protein UBRO2_04485 [Ustilago bromivora]|uniref:Uncharacterized protein n=1 Tax=Ustilago bromivora TaxID=307758 RepID=A0A8H8TV41_9BASI|nr:uncharacterized protein UBRO2_04485 [Ustilago bromivora]